MYDTTAAMMGPGGVARSASYLTPVRGANSLYDSVNEASVLQRGADAPAAVSGGNPTYDTIPGANSMPSAGGDTSYAMASAAGTQRLASTSGPGYTLASGLAGESPYAMAKSMEQSDAFSNPGYSMSGAIPLRGVQPSYAMAGGMQRSDSVNNPGYAVASELTTESPYDTAAAGGLANAPGYGYASSVPTQEAVESPYAMAGSVERADSVSNPGYAMAGGIAVESPYAMAGSVERADSVSNPGYAMAGGIAVESPYSMAGPGDHGLELDPLYETAGTIALHPATSPYAMAAAVIEDNDYAEPPGSLPGNAYEIPGGRQRPVPAKRPLPRTPSGSARRPDDSAC